MAQREPKAFPIEPLRYLSLIAVVFSLLGSALMFLGGAAKSIKAVRIFFLGETLSADPPPPAHLDSGDQALVAVLQSMDAFLIALVLLIFSFGVYKLFIAEITTPKNLPGAPWAQITSIEGLKKVLVEVHSGDPGSSVLVGSRLPGSRGELDRSGVTTEHRASRSRAEARGLALALISSRFRIRSNSFTSG